MRAARWRFLAPLCMALMYAQGVTPAPPDAVPATAVRYIGMDRNDYPGDAMLSTLHKSFRFTGYWLNAPPGEAASNWTGKREVLKAHDFGFLLLWNGRLDKELKSANAAAMGRADGAAAVKAALKEGFHTGALIFLDQEEGGRLLPEQSAYILAFIDTVRQARWRAGVYCSGVAVPDGNGSTITTAQDLTQQASARGVGAIPLWVAREECPPSPGCSIAPHPQSPSAALGIDNAVVWQYALSPRRPQFTSGCPKNYDADGKCYPPGVPHTALAFVDLNIAGSTDPSGGRE